MSSVSGCAHSSVCPLWTQVIPFSWRVEFHRMDMPPLVHSPVEVYLGGLQVLVILNQATVNCVLSVVVALGTLSGGIAGRMVGAVCGGLSISLMTNDGDEQMCLCVFVCLSSAVSVPNLCPCSQNQIVLIIHCESSLCSLETNLVSYI